MTADPFPDRAAEQVLAAVQALAAGVHAHAELVEAAGREWARAHRSARVMWERLIVLETLLDGRDETEQAALHRAWRAVADRATEEALARLEQAALEDPLTGAGNRRAMEAALRQAIAGTGRLDQPLAVVMVDLDGLKHINDGQGHEAGDQALVDLVRAMRSQLRAEDSVFRTGGDEFVAVLTGAATADVPRLMARIARAGAPAFSWGVAGAAEPSASVDALLAAADADLYRRRRAERGPTPARRGVGARGQHPPIPLRPVLARSRRAVVAAAAVLVLGGGAAALAEEVVPAPVAAPPAHPPARVVHPADGGTGRARLPRPAPAVSVAPPVPTRRPPAEPGSVANAGAVRDRVHAPRGAGTSGATAPQPSGASSPAPTRGNAAARPVRGSTAPGTPAPSPSGGTTSGHRGGSPTAPASSPPGPVASLVDGLTATVLSTTTQATNTVNGLTNALLGVSTPGTSGG